MTSNVRKLGVLMWKHLIVRTRRFIFTPVEILCPGVLFLLMFIFRSYLQMEIPKSGAHLQTNIRNTETFTLKRAHGPTLVLHTPSTEFTDTLMDEVAAQLELRRLDTVPDLNARGYYALENGTSSLAPDFIKHLKHTTAIVIFQDDMGTNETLPNHLNYTIRMNTPFMTHLYHSLDDDIGPHQRFGTIYEPFMRLQWAIDTSYLKLLSGNEIKQKLSFQEFPYVDSQEAIKIDLLSMIMMLICFVSLMLPFLFLVTRLVEERINGTQELVKLSGVSGNLIFISHALNTLPSGLVYSVGGAMFLTITDTALVSRTNPIYIFLALFLGFASVMSIGFAVSCIINSVQYTTTITLISYLVIWQPSNQLQRYTPPRAVKMLMGLLPHQPMSWFVAELNYLETHGDGITWTEMWKWHTAKSGSVFASYICNIVQIVIFSVLTWYLSQVCPGPYGVPLRWNFPFKRSFWSKKKVTPDVTTTEGEEEPITTAPQFFEQPPADAEVGIRITNVTKVFDKMRALSNVSLDIYKGEITVLLGHNGAGKTTLMNIITGMSSPTEGSVSVGGLQVADSSSRRAGTVGFCPQHNVFFADLTVREHAMFFLLLKGKSFVEAEKTTAELLQQLALSDKADSNSAVLSGGMKRRLQLACALASNADVLVLDEPTSGLDVETRRELWDLLLSLRGSRTVVLSTHFMEEADALGDRAAALHSGQLRCYATPMFLKKSIGTGYRLSLTTIGPPKENAIRGIVASIIPDASLNDITSNSVSYNLPAQHSDRFPKLFTELEAKKPELGVDSIGVGVSTLEEVFLHLCSDTAQLTQDEIDGTRIAEPPKLLTGFRLYKQQVAALVQRQLRFIWAKKWFFLLFQVIIPNFIIITMTMSLRNIAEDSSPANGPIEMQLNMYDDMPTRRVLYHVDNPRAIEPLVEKYYKVSFESTPDVAAAVLRTGQENRLEYNNYLVGLEMNDTDVKVLYTTIVRHAAPIAVNLASNALAARLLPWVDGDVITATNHPLAELATTASIKSPVTLQAACVWALFVVLMVTQATLNALSLPIKEREAGTRHILVLSGCSPALHWLAALLTPLALYAALLVLPAAAACAAEPTHTFTDIHFIGTLFVVLFTGVMAFLAFIYLCSLFLTSRAAGIVTTVVVIAGLTSGAVKTSSEIYELKTGVWGILLGLMSITLPPHAIVAGVYKSTNVAITNALCTLNQDMCPDFGLVVEGCCGTGNPSCYICSGAHKPITDIIILLCQFVVYMVLVIMAQHGILNEMFSRLVNAWYTPPLVQHYDEMAKAERIYVNKAISLPTKQIPDAMLVNDIYKTYFRWAHPRTPIHAVKGVSFSVKKGECFGLLGVNGAGKSTTFKMLTAEQYPTRGTLFANGHRLKQPRKKYLESLGYCPQNSGLDDFLTGRQNLTLLLALRGLAPADRRQEVEAWLDVVGLQRYADTAAAAYSGGCARRLASAAALCAGAALALLDEPTAGVDVAARRRVWAALRRARAQAQAVLITSHSMDEMEALCDRIAILSGGAVCALGGAPTLRANYASGHAVRLKIRATPHTDTTDSTTGGGDTVDRLKQQLHEKFNCTLKDEHKTMLHYHINETMRYSELFTALEQLKQTYSELIEDYCVTETTLEEVFLSFAQPQTRAHV